MVKIPKRTAGRPTPRGRGTPLIGAENVPQAPQMESGGVPTVPKASGGEGLEASGSALFDVGVEMAAAEVRIQNRLDTVSRAKARTGFSEASTELFNKFSAEKDFSDPAVVEEYGVELQALKEEALTNHTGSDDSLARLDVLLEGIRGQAAAFGAEESRQQGVKAVTESLNQNVAPFIIETRKDPSKIFENFTKSDLEVDEVAGTFTPAETAGQKRLMRGVLAEAAIEGHLQRSQFIQAMNVLNDPRINAFLSPKKVLALSERIATSKSTGGPSRDLTATEIKALGFPEGTFAQRKANNDLIIRFKPETDDTQRTKKIDGLKSRFVKQGMTEEDATDRATDIVDGNIEIEVSAVTGKATEKNIVKGTVKVVPFGSPPTSDPGAVPEQEPEPTLFELADRGNIAGIVPSVEELFTETFGQIPFLPAAEQTVQDRQTVLVEQNALIRAISINPRFPVGEINRIREEIKIAPSMFDSRRALMSRMVGIDKSLRKRLEGEVAASKNPNLPPKTQAAAAQAAKDIGNFLVRLGVPKGFKPGSNLPKGAEKGKRIGTTRDGKPVFEMPDGTRKVLD